MERKAQAMDMEQWKGMAENICFRHLPDLDDVLCILDQIPLSKNRPFGLARRSGGIDEHGRVVGISLPLKKLRGGRWK
jgi:hypothetical protein